MIKLSWITCLATLAVLAPMALESRSESTEDGTGTMRPAATLEGPQPAGPTTKEIDRSDRGFRLTVPANWVEYEEKDQKSISVSLMFPSSQPEPRGATTFHVYVRLNASRVTLEQLVESWKKAANSNQQFNYHEPEEIELDGIKALAIRSEGEIDGKAVFRRAVIAIRGARNYVLHTQSSMLLADVSQKGAAEIERSWKWRASIPPTAATKPADATVERDALAADKTLFNGKRNGFTLVYPKSWFVKRDFPVAQIKFAVYPDGEPLPQATPKYTAHLVLMVVPIPRGEAERVTVNSLAEELIRLSKRDNAGAQVLESKNTKVSGIDAYQFVEKYKLQAFNVQRMVVCMLKDGRQYTFQFVAEPADFEKHVGEMKEVIESINWYAPAATPGPATPARRSGGASTQPATADRVSLSREVVAAVQAADKELRTVDNRQAGLRYSYPSAWKELRPDDPNAVVAQYALEPFGDEITATVMIGRMDKNSLTRDTRQTARMLALAGAQGSESLHSGECKISDSNGHQATYAGRKMRSIAVAVEHDNHVYTFSFTAPDRAFEAWLPTFNRLIESVKWTDGEAAE